MLTDVSLLAALLVGFFGGVHCVGMCGGIVGALTLGLAPEARARPFGNWPFHIAYNAGRLVSYALAGALAGGVGGLLLQFALVHRIQLVLQLVAAFFMLALGLYLGGWWSGLTRIERLGGLIWRRLEPLGRRYLPIASPGQAFLFGMIWGWLPCGLVYSVLVWSLAAGSASQGAALMLSFGVGTLPTLLAMGVLAAALGSFVRRPWPRRIAGMLVLAFGIIMLIRAFSA